MDNGIGIELYYATPLGTLIYLGYEGKTSQFLKLMFLVIPHRGITNKNRKQQQ